MSEALLKQFADKLTGTVRIDPALYGRYNVKRGLRNADGTGVLVGLTNIGNVHGYIIDENEKVAVPGELFYRGINVKEIVAGVAAEHRQGFEETAFLLMFGELPTETELAGFCAMLDKRRDLPPGFKESAILRTPSENVMNKLARSILSAYSYDENPDDCSIPNVLRQSVELMARLPTMAAYAYQAKAHYHRGESLFLHHPEAGKSTAENFLMLTRADLQYTAVEAETLDLCLILHAEHGGGNNSAFTTHVVTSSGTDTYSAIAAAVLSLKGPRHGGANLQVYQMVEDLKRNVPDWSQEGAVADYLNRLLDGEGFDRSGLIYGLGHAVYTISDPRTLLLKEKARDLAAEQGLEDEWRLYDMIERLGPELFNKRRNQDRPLCANVDLFSGLVYKMLKIPVDLYTPLFAVSRVVGWCAHRLEEIMNGGKIIRPAYKAIGRNRSYLPMSERSPS